MCTSDSVRLIDCNRMLKLCHTSQQQQDFIHIIMKKLDYITPDEVTYNTLIGQFLMEGEHEQAQQVVETMTATGIQPNETTEEWLNMSTEMFKEKCTFKLNYMIKSITSNADCNAARQFFNHLTNQHLNTVDQYTAMLTISHDSIQAIELLHAMEKDNILPTIQFYSKLISMARQEGDDVQAFQLIDEMETKYNIEQNDTLKEFMQLSLSGKDLNRLRQSKLTRLLRDGSNGSNGSNGSHNCNAVKETEGWNDKESGSNTDATKAAWQLLHTLIERKLVNVFHFTVLLKSCHDSNQMKELIHSTMKEANVKPDEITYRTLANQLKKEGKEQEANDVINAIQQNVQVNVKVIHLQNVEDEIS